MGVVNLGDLGDAPPPAPPPAAPFIPITPFFGGGISMRRAPVVSERDDSQERGDERPAVPTVTAAPAAPAKKTSKAPFVVGGGIVAALFAWLVFK